ncbi:MAG: ABC transporter ATP-binding protein [Clostridia bacterium]|nr:ABC transporter ATP-binding protein [Clostridia bacterium]
MIEVKKLTKRFGDFTALQDISLTVDDGSVYGLVGYNGAGKTTLLKNISGIYKPEDGEVLFDGENIFNNEKKKEELFFMPDDLYFGPYANMKKMADFYNGYYNRFDYSTFNRLVEAFGLDPKKRINGFSKGMQRQAEMVLALSTHPKLLLLDESFDGIDPQKRLLMKGLLKETIKDYGTSVIISSHNLQELENLCDHIGIINGKKISITGAVDELSYGKTKFRLAFAREFTLEEFSNIKCENLVKDGQLAMFTVSGNTDEAEEQIKLLAPAVTEKISLSLEEIFMQEMEGTDYDYKSILA